MTCSRNFSFRKKISPKYNLSNTSSKHTELSPKSVYSKPKTSEKYSTAQAPIKNSSPPKWNTKVRGKIPNVNSNPSMHKIHLTRNPSENPLRNAWTKVSQCRTRFGTVHHRFHSVASVVTQVFCHHRCTNKKTIWFLRRSWAATVSDQSAWNCIANVSRKKYFATKTATATTAATTSRTWQNTNRQ